jgi:hypothetical protein
MCGAMGRQRYTGAADWQAAPCGQRASLVRYFGAGAEGAREAAQKAAREADRAEAEAWSERMEGYGGPAQPSPTIAQCLNGGLGWSAIAARPGRACRSASKLSLNVGKIS